MELLVYQPSLFCCNISNHICLPVGLSPAEALWMTARAATERSSLMEGGLPPTWALRITEAEAVLGERCFLSTPREHAQGLVPWVRSKIPKVASFLIFRSERVSHCWVLIVILSVLGQNLFFNSNPKLNV